VLLLYLVIVTIAGLMGVLLFRSTVPSQTGDIGLVSDDFANAWSNFPLSWITMFIVLSTADNLTGVLISTSSTSAWYMFFFVSFTIVGTMMVAPMVIGLFQDGFQKMRERANRKQKLFDRTGLVAAFILLDLDDR
jgi:hypothetical protein